ncbi:hypothetical protein C2G38_2159323 [Gigaspora rosea]|uniref:Uncharacterized protein n=1 Tax=Gigaspora rosea TaxID=44941 RepID=A0A397W3P7_9GLOM|nr:hypothetical protein C2G38_2159323 [Gigaspora rosea]
MSKFLKLQSSSANPIGDLDLKTSNNDIVLPTAWDIKDKSPFIDIDSSGLKPFNLLKNLLIKDPDDYKAAVVRANHPVPSELTSISYLLGQENKENESWGCSYHGDDGCSFYSGSGRPYWESYTTDDIIGCYLNFKNNIELLAIYIEISKAFYILVQLTETPNGTTP